MSLCFIICPRTFLSCLSSRFFVFSIADLISNLLLLFPICRCDRKTTQRTEKADEHKRKHNRK